MMVLRSLAMGCLGSNDLYALLFQLEPLLIDIVVLQDHLAGRLQVTSLEGVQRFRYSLFNHAAQNQEITLQHPQMPVEVRPYHDAPLLRWLAS